MAPTSPPIPEALDAAIRLAKRDIQAAILAVRTLRRRALRIGDRQGASSCLVALQLFASTIGQENQEMRLATKLVSERGAWFDFYSLGRLYERRGRISKARSLYEYALSDCPRNDPDREQVVSALARLTKRSAIGRHM